MEEQLAMAMEVADCEFNTTRKNKIDNPPMVTIATWHMSKCKGCKKTITPEDKEFPHNFVFRRTGVVGFFNRLTNKWVDSEQNIHIHLNMACLRQQDKTTYFGEWWSFLLTCTRTDGISAWARLPETSCGKENRMTWGGGTKYKNH